jgi:hypothetical protein
MKAILCVGILLSTIASQAQTVRKTQAKKAGAKTTQVKKQSTRSTIDSANIISLTSTAAYTAKSDNANSSTLTISDPILRAFDARANGANVSLGKSGIVGMPKRAYGFANGHILLKTTGATTSGTQTGSGSVGTGTSLGTFGSTGTAMAVNGKSPDAGINMWGNAHDMNIIRSDSTITSRKSKKQ